jgi:hypothetical protein
VPKNGRVDALERIATALEKLAYGKIAVEK